MKQESNKPRVFGIGLPFGGGTVLGTLFEANGYRWRHWMAGRLASNIAYTRACKTVPLRPWGQAHGFSGLYGPAKTHLPQVNAYRMFRYLHQHFPDAYFIHTHFDSADWVTARFLADDGAHRALSAAQLDCHPEALPAQWLQDQAKHRAACTAYFDGNPRFLDFDVNQGSISALCQHFSEHFDLSVPEVLPDMSVAAGEVETVLSHLEATPEPPQVPEPDAGFCEQVARHCAATSGPDGSPRALSRAAVLWQSLDQVQKRDGSEAPLVRHASKGPYLRDPDAGQFERPQSVLNALQRYDVRPPVWVDMMDARFVGANGRAAAPTKTIAYNRREGAKNITLWPLPGYHSLAPTGQMNGYSKDTVAFEDKDDHCVWLGNLTGRMSPVLAPEGCALRSVYAIRDDAEALGDRDEGWDAIAADLDCVPRYRFVRTYKDHPDFTAALVLRGPWKALRLKPAFDGLWTYIKPATWFHQFRYVVSLAGNDTGSNFLPTAASNSLILKEEDGWELFYTSMFKPWVHYVPLGEGALDVEEKLAWARANPSACQAMVHACRAVFDKLAAPQNQSAILERIAQDLNAR